MIIEPLPTGEDNWSSRGALTLKVNELIEQVNRQTEAISTLSALLVQAQTGFAMRDLDRVIKILEGED